MNVAEIACRRYTTKAFDPTQKVSDAHIEQLKTILRNAPSSVNSQPWHFVVVSTDEGKSCLTAATDPASAYNSAKIKNASHVVVMCAREDLDEAHLANVLAQEAADGRFPSPEGKTAQQNGRNFYVGLHREQRQDLHAWMDRQVYIALGMLLFGATALNIDSCAIEGFDAVVLDEVLNLPAQGLRSVVMVALGYRSNADFNAELPKSRLANTEIFSTR